MPLSALVAVALFARGSGRLRGRGRREEAGRDRAALFAAGTLAGLLGLLLLLHGRAGERASAHMLQRVLVGDLAPAVVLVGLRGRLLFALEQFLTLGAFTFFRLGVHFREPCVVREGPPLRA